MLYIEGVVSLPVIKPTMLPPQKPPITDITVALIVGGVQLLLRIIRSKNV